MQYAEMGHGSKRCSGEAARGMWRGRQGIEREAVYERWKGHPNGSKRYSEEAKGSKRQCSERSVWHVLLVLRGFQGRKRKQEVLGEEGSAWEGQACGYVAPSSGRQMEVGRETEGVGDIVVWEVERWRQRGA